MHLEKIENILPSTDEREFLIDYFQGFSKTFFLRYGKVDLEGLFSMYAPLYVESISQLCIKNRDYPYLNAELDNIKSRMKNQKDTIHTNFIKHIKPDFSLQMNKDLCTSFKILKVNQSFFLVEYNDFLDIKVIVNFHNEKKDYYLYQENFVKLLKELIHMLA